nr:hypothetical protein [bacterium]
TPSLTSQMVLDINTNTPSSNPSRMVAIGSTAYFTADDGVHGVELYKSDGIEEYFDNEARLIFRSITEMVGIP